MIETKSCLNILIGILFCTSRVNGIFEINLPASGNYNEATEMNCTDSSFNIANGYIWYKDDLVIYDNINGDATNTGKYTSTHGVGFFTLVITNTTLDDNGMYKCSYNFQDKNDTLEIQAKGTGDGKLDGILKITLTKFYPNSTEVLSVVGSGMTFPGTQTITAAGDLFTIVWTSDADVDSSYVKNGCDVTIQSVTTYVIHADVKVPPAPSPAPSPGKKCWCLVKCDIPVCVICWIIIIIVLEFIIGAILGCFMYCRGGRYDCFNTHGRLPWFFKKLAFSVIFSAVALGIYLVWRCIGRQAMENKRPEEQPMRDTKTDV